MVKGQPTDWLDHDAAVAEFVSSYEPPIVDFDTAEARRALVDARSLIGQIIGAGVDGLAADLMADIDAAMESASVHVENSSEGPQLRISSADPARAVAIASLVNAIELCSRRPERIRCCEHDNCMLWFLDTSRGGRRRWCSMERCGNRAKAQRHYQRSIEVATTDGDHARSDKY